MAERGFWENLFRTPSQRREDVVAAREAEQLRIAREVRALLDTLPNARTSARAGSPWDYQMLLQRLLNEVALIEAREATERSVKLLDRHLTKSEQKSLKHHGHIIVKGKTRTYRIHGTGAIYIVDPEKGWTLCTSPKGQLPIHDQILAAKLMIEGAEEEFLRVANPNSSSAFHLTPDPEIVLINGCKYPRSAAPLGPFSHYEDLERLADRMRRGGGAETWRDMMRVFGDPPPPNPTTTPVHVWPTLPTGGAGGGGTTITTTTTAVAIPPNTAGGGHLPRGLRPRLTTTTFDPTTNTTHATFVVDPVRPDTTFVSDPVLPPDPSDDALEWLTRP